MSAPGAAARWAGSAPLIAPLAALTSAVIVVVTQAVGSRELPSEANPVAVMVPATAAGLLLSALALVLVRSPRWIARRLGQIAAVVVLLLGLVTIGQTLAGLEVQGTFIAGGGWWLQRPGLTTAACLVMFGASALALTSRRETVRGWSRVFASGTLYLALAGLIGHLYGASALYGLNRWGGMATSTGFALFLLGVGALFADPSRGIAAVFLSRSVGGHVLRRLTPNAIFAPILLGWVALLAQKAGWVDAAYGTALLIIVLIAPLQGLLSRQAKVLHALDADRERLLASERESRARATNILESITDGFIAVDTSWRLTYVNREAERLLMRPRSELLGRNLWTEFPEAVGAAFQREYQRAMAEQKTVEFEAHFPPLERWFNVRAYPSAEGLSIYFHDVSERRRAEEMVRASEARYRQLADMIPQHIWTTTPAGHHTYFSRRWFDFTGTTPEENRGDVWIGRLHPDDRERALARWRHSVATGEPFAAEYRFRAADGRYVWFLGQAEPLRDEEGNIVEWFGTLTDISLPKQLDEERERLLAAEQKARSEAERRREALERVTESRASLMRGFGHDVRNPLGAAQVTAELLEKGRMYGALSERQLEAVRRIRRGIHNSLRLIDDLLEMARAESGQLELHLARTDVGHVAREIGEEFREQASKVGLDVEIRAAEGLEANTDPARVRQIVANLLSNAVKYAPKGTVTIDAGHRPSGGPAPGEWITLCVIDTGPGIPREKWEAIFQEYTRLDPQAQHGAGIGLAISRRIARLLGGELTVRSELGRGSNFTLWLPPVGSRPRPPVDETGRGAANSHAVPTAG